ncbi:MAG: methyltransferase domain-containing protein [Azoarcus sp.]|jgi:SAM-dependent methyltransferase|nr:methyltransferase domain-containing protein [Azoarcus sp.]
MHTAHTEKTALRPCPVCGKNQAEILTTMRYAVLERSPLPAASDIVCCLACGMVYADTPGTQADYDRHYAGFAAYEQTNGIGSGTDENDARRIEESADWLAARIGAKNARIIDIGCAQGGLLKALSRRGFSSLAGIDPSARCVERLKAAEIPAWQGYLGHLPAECGKGDLVVISHVLEHVVDVAGTLSALHKLLTPEGKVYIEVPDAAGYHNMAGTLPFQFIHQEHINHFDLPHLAMLCTLHGFGVSEIVRKSIGDRHDIDLDGGRGGDFALGILLIQDKQNKLSAPSTCREDRAGLKRHIATYILESQRLLAAQAASSLSIEIKNRPIALWGAGMQTQRILATPGWKETNIVAIVDRDPNKQGKSLAGCIIEPPEKGLRHLPDNTLVIISAHHYAEEIKSELAMLDADLFAIILKDNPHGIPPPLKTYRYHGNPRRRIHRPPSRPPRRAPYLPHDGRRRDVPERRARPPNRAGNHL